MSRILFLFETKNGLNSLDLIHVTIYDTFCEESLSEILRYQEDKKAQNIKSREVP